MSQFFDHLEFWHWLILALVLAGVEMLTPGFFAIWLGGAALITGLLVLVVPGMSWEGQLVLFAVLAVVSVL
ncbi:MAG TPA: NfeD family protein, partial [Candidatus Binatia bacterium]|nr:NfeD family protein [Candidatus Binatia bacterium]